MSALEHIPAGARQLGVRVAPQLRLAMGYRDEERRGAPVKTDYLIAKLGSEGEHRRQAEKFYEVYGEKPKAVDILLPPEIRHALVIQYRAWGSSGDENGGVLKAIGHTNYALEDYVGGADVLTVWNPDGTVAEVETAGLDAQTGEPLDDLADELGLDLYTTFRFMLPKVLGFGSFAEITSKGKKTTDNLWGKCQLYYGMFGSKVTFAIEPKLVIVPATARPIVKKKDEAPKRIKSSIYVLDLVLPETMQDSIDRLAQRQQAISGVGGPARLLYGPPNGVKELEAPASVSPSEAGETQPVTAGPAREAEEAASPSDSNQDAAPASDFEGEPGDEGEQLGFVPPTPEAQQAQRDAQAAGLTYIEGGKHAGKTLIDFYTEKPKVATSWFGWVLERPTHPNYVAVLAYARVFAPEALEGKEL